MDTASLIIKVDSSSAAKATANLDKLDKAAGNTERAANKVGKAWGVALGAVAVAGIGLATAALSKYIRNTIEAERVQAQLAARIKDTGGAAGRTLAQLNEQAAKLQNLTVFDDEAIGGVQAMLLTFKEIQGVNFDDATAAVLDLSTAMGTDLNSSALQLGKALNDPIKGIGALSRAGVQFSVDQKAMIKSLVETGDKAGAQRVILRELEGQMGTAAEAARDTLGGALKALQNSFDNLLEGDSGDAGVKGTRKAIEGLIRTLNDPDTKRGVDTMISGIVGIANAAAVAVTEIADLWERAQRFTTLSLGGTGNSYDRKQIDYEIQSQEERVAGLVGRQDRIATEARSRLDELRRLRQDNADLFGDPNQQRMSFSTDGPIPESMLRPKASSGGATADPKATKNFSGVIRDNSKAIAENEAALRKRILATDDFDRSMVDMEDTQRDWSDRLEELTAQLEGPAAEAALTYKRNLDELNAAKARGAVTAIDAAKWEQALGEEYRRNKVAAEEYGQAVDEVTFAQEANTATSYAFEDAFASVLDGSRSAKDAFRDFADSVLKDISRIIAKKAALAIFGGGMDSQGNTAGSIMDLFSGDWGFAKGGAFNNGHVTAFANGGVVDGPSLFPMSGGKRGLMGEAGPEAIIPLQRGRDGKLGVAGGATTNNNITINVPKTTENRTANQIALATAQALQLAQARR